MRADANTTAQARKPMQTNHHRADAETTVTEQVDKAMASRLSVRAFTQQPVARDTIERLVAAAAWDTVGDAPLPCTVHVLQGRSRAALCDKVCAIHDAVRAEPALRAQYPEPYDYYPQQWFSPYIDRRRENGWGLYGLLGIGKTDKDKMHAQHQRNYRYFDAPVGLVFTMDRACGGAHLLLCGRFMQSLMLHARLQDLHTCPQAAWNMFSGVVLPHVAPRPRR
jgi:nitroreductase